MKYAIQILNYDSEWVTYAKSPADYYTERVIEDLHHHGFKNFQIRIIEI